MKKGMIVFLALVIISLLSVSVSALSISNIMYDEKINKNYESIDFYVKVKNPNSFKERVTTSATILETGDYALQKKRFSKKKLWNIFIIN